MFHYTLHVLCCVGAVGNALVCWAKPPVGPLSRFNAGLGWVAAALLFAAEAWRTVGGIAP